MTILGERWSQLLLQFGPSLTRLRRLPLLGPCLSWAGAVFVPRQLRVWVQVQDGPAAGIWFRLNPRTGRDAFAGQGELEVQRAFQEYIRPNMTVYDVGANMGFFSLLAARLVGPGGRVVAFEADPEVAVRLREHIVRNKFSWVAVEEKAVWSETCSVLFARTDTRVSPDRGLGHVVGTEEADTIRVDAVSLDEYSSAFPPPDFLKCDVEGAEAAVFRGAERLLTERRPIVLCEMHGQENRRTVVAHFVRSGYACKPLNEHHVLALPK